MIRCGDGSLYTGLTTDMARRLDEHQQSAAMSRGKVAARIKGAKALRGKGPLAVAFTAPAPDRSIASKMEYRIKQLSKAQKEALVAGRIPIEEVMPADEAS